MFEGLSHGVKVVVSYDIAVLVSYEHVPLTVNAFGQVVVFEGGVYFVWVTSITQIEILRASLPVRVASSCSRNSSGEAGREPVGGD